MTARVDENIRDDHARAGDVSCGEAHEILCRFVASHFRDGRPHARFTIPVDPTRDDDIRMSAFIARAKRNEERIRRLELALRSAFENRGDRASYAEHAAAFRVLAGTETDADVAALEGR